MPGEGRLHLCLEGARSLADLAVEGHQLEVEALGTRRVRARFPLAPGAGGAEVLEGDLPPEAIAFAWGRVGELSLPLAALGVDGTGEVYLTFQVLREGEVLERAPLYHTAQVPIPSDYDLESWSA
ncbi:MAG: hypothetical protein HGA98_04935 [Deltaproteobacteria bacterium]|nr:hypothetical protein [Deltaproteobacteria bacterium]